MPGVRPVPGSAENPLEWKLFITGPEFYNVGGERRKCPYGGRVFEATVKYPSSYPFTHPDVSHVLDSPRGDRSSSSSGVRIAAAAGCCRSAALHSGVSTAVTLGGQCLASPRGSMC